MPTLFNRAFAESGDKTTPPDNDNSGFVSFVQGYTADYERNLASGDVLAKAVERPIQNALFNQITDHLLWYQTHGFMQWVSGKTDGYTAGDMVVDTASTTNPIWRIFRARKSGVTSKPTSQSTTSTDPNWEEILLPSAQRALIPFQAGRDFINTRNSSSSFVTSGTIAALNKGFYIVPNSAAVAAISDKPVKLGDSTPLKPFTIEIAHWDTTESGSSTSYRIERVVTADNQIFVRTVANASQSQWIQQVIPQHVARGWLNLATATATAGGVSLTTTVPFTANAGAALHFLCPKASPGDSDFTIVIGPTTYNLVGRDNLRLCKNAIVENTFVQIIFISDTTAMLLSAPSGQYQVPVATEDNAAPTWKQVKDLFATALNFDKIFPIGFAFGFMNGTDPNTTYPGTVWTKMEEGTVWRNKEAGDAYGVIKGSDTTKLILRQIPFHSHNVNIVTTAGGGGTLTTNNSDLGTKQTSAAGGHNHAFSGTTNNGGYHSHGASSDVQGAHAHAFVGDDQLPPLYGVAQDNAARYDADSSFNNWARLYWTSTAGAHSHNISVGGSGDHVHSFSGFTSSVADHTHSVVLGPHNHSLNVPTHTHTTSGNTGGAGQVNPDDVPTLPRSIGLVGWWRTA